MTEIAIPAASGGEVKVQRDGDTVTVVWLCGGRYSFSPEDLRSSIANVEVMRAAPEAWVNDQDTHGGAYYGRIGDDGEFYGAGGVTDNAGHVPWEQLRDALHQALEAESEDRKRLRRGRQRKGS